MLPSRCLRCGAVSRDPLCGSCLDYLVAYRPFWLYPSLLPGPSLLDLLGPREVAILAADGDRTEWRSTSREPTARDAVRLLELLDLENGSPALSVGDAEVFHAFLAQARRSVPFEPREREALAKIYRFLASQDWIPPHLASEYALRARALVTTSAEEEGAVGVVRIEGPPLPVPGPAEEVVARGEEGAVTSEEAPMESESPLPAPETSPVPEPEPQPEPQAEPEEVPLVPAPAPSPAPSEAAAEAERIREEVERERAEVEAWVRARSEEFEAKERSLAEKEKALEAKAKEIEEAERVVTERLIALEKDEARREVLRFLGTVPGMTEDQAKVLATAFPDMESLRAADAKALTQCQGVSEALAKAIRLELVPGEVEEEERAAGLREEAQAFLEEGDYESALECYNRLLSERPEDKALWFDKADVLLLLDRKEEALQCYTRVLDLDRRDSRAWFERGNLLFGMGRLADAVDALKAALAHDPSRAPEVLQKAEQLRRDGHPNEAAILFQAVLDVNPDNGRAILGLGDTFIDLGDTDAAEGLFTRALGKDGNNPLLLFRKGELLNRKGRWGAAIQFYNRAIALRWNFPEAWTAKGETLLAHGRAQEALECFEKALTFDERSVAAWAGKARVHHVLHASDAAREALRRATEIDPEHPAVKAARAAIAPASEEAAATAFAAAWKAVLEETEEERREAAPAEVPADLRAFVDSVESDREDVSVLLQLAELALEGGDPEMALRRYEEALGQDPGSAEAWTGKGTALQQLERYEEALQAYDRALELRPDYEVARRWRETCLRHIRPEGRS